ncbi:MAG: hypothetical protein PSV35_00005, partial [bacterium]|nr:hypothetical protein [bacterium]
NYKFSKSFNYYVEPFRELYILRAYTQFMHDWLKIVKTADGKNAKSLVNFFDVCTLITNKYVKLLEENPNSNADKNIITSIINVLKNVANFIIKIVTLGYSLQFFNTAPKPLNDINEVLPSIRAIREKLVNLEETSEEYMQPTAYECTR